MYLPMPPGRLWKGTEGFGCWMYWATGIMTALRIVPSHKSGWNCLACSSPYQPADLLLRLFWDYAQKKTWTFSGLLSWSLGDVKREAEKWKRTKWIKINRQWGYMTTTMLLATISNSISLFHFPTRLVFWVKHKKTHTNTHVSFMMSVS